MVTEAKTSPAPIETRIYNTLSSILTNETPFTKEKNFLIEQLGKAVEKNEELIAVPIIAVFKKHGSGQDALILQEFLGDEKTSLFIRGAAERAILEIESR